MGDGKSSNDGGANRGDVRSVIKDENEEEAQDHEQCGNIQPWTETSRRISELTKA